MKIALIHLSDFHVKSDANFSNTKINRFIECLNVLGNVDEYVIVFSGDLAFSGEALQYKHSRYIFGRIIAALREKNGNKFVNLILTPGNHDLCLPHNARERADIQKNYDNGTIETLLPDEFDFLNNYYLHSNLNGRTPYNKTLERRFHTYGAYKIQYNIINTAPFSTLKPDDKELHYFPKENLHLLKKSEDANLCVTVMHHSPEWFYWNYKSDLEKAIIDNSEILMTGHDHQGKTSTVSINNSLDTWVSAAGEMDFTSIDKKDSFNVVLIDTEKNCFDGYIYSWNPVEKIYFHDIAYKQKSLQNHTSQMLPLPSFIKSLKEDTFNSSDDFTKYFVFPKLISECKNEFGKYNEAKSLDDFQQVLEHNKKIMIIGSANSGKSTLLKSLYLSLLGKTLPLLLVIDNKTKFKPNNFVKLLFEDQYGNEPVAFERYQQMDKSKRILLVDNWDLLDVHQNLTSLLAKINDNFGFVVFTSSKKSQDIIAQIKEEITETFPFCEMRIKPFFAEKRNQLIRNIYTLNSTTNTEDVAKVNKLIDAVVKNNSSLFQLNPAFLIRYTNYLMRDPYYDYAKGEAAFSKVFEFELQQSIISIVKKTDVDEILTAFEEIAGYMYTSRNDILKIEDIRKIVEQYAATYGVLINVRTVIETGLRAKLFKQTDDYDIYFYNKNQLAYFIAKYLIRTSQNDPTNGSGIAYALKNICFGVNSDIILFISYLSSNTKIIMSIVEHAKELLSPWEPLSLRNSNIALLKNDSQSNILPLTTAEQQELEAQNEEREEAAYPDEDIEARGLFDYDDSKIEDYQYRLIRSIKYTEMICKALPAFHSSLKVSQKEEIIDVIYSYPRKITYALLRPIDIHVDIICDEILNFLSDYKTKKAYTKNDIQRMLTNYSRAVFLSMVDHFTEICTSPKTFPMLEAKDISEESEMIERLLIIENNDNSELLLKEAESIIKSNTTAEAKLMAKLVVRKYIFSNPELSFNRKQQFIDKIFGKKMRKSFLLPN